MELRRNLLFSIAALVVLNLLFAFGAIGLFGRMGPAIDRILQDNVYSIEACEVMLAELARSNGGQAGRKRFEDALQRAEKNVTEPDEGPVIERIRNRAARALDGYPDAADAIVDDITALIQINREAMGAADREARRLGRSGAWAAVFMGFLSFVLSLIVLRYIEGRVVAPIEQVHAVLEASRRGDIHRRCHSMSAPAEIKAVMRSVNSLLDSRMSDGVE
jgi:nitrate/nitrite-specific signal transduction histidine kinase